MKAFKFMHSIEISLDARIYIHQLTNINYMRIERPGPMEQGDKNTVEQILGTVEQISGSPAVQIEELEKYIDKYKLAETARILELTPPPPIIEYSAEAMKWRHAQFQKSLESGTTVLGQLSKKRQELLDIVERGNRQAREKREKSEKITALVDKIKELRDSRAHYVDTLHADADYADSNTDAFDKEINRAMEMLDRLQPSNE